MNLIEIIMSRYTSEETLQSTLDLCQIYGKETVVAKRDVWFFLAARAHSGWIFEANLMHFIKQTDIREIDAVARYKLGLPMGPFELMDFTGIVDIRPKGLKSGEEISKTYPDYEPWPLFLALNRYMVKELWNPMTEKGLFGVKTGKGFYDYPVGKYVKPEIPQELAEKIDPIQLLAPAINMAAWCVTNGVGTIDDVDKSLRLGFNWPRGFFEYVEELGINNIINVLKAKREKAPGWLKDFYKVDPLLTKWAS